jgi:hypothetical protein
MLDTELVKTNADPQPRFLVLFSTNHATFRGTSDTAKLSFIHRIAPRNKIYKPEEMEYLNQYRYGLTVIYVHRVPIVIKLIVSVVDPFLLITF